MNYISTHSYFLSLLYDINIFNRIKLKESQIECSNKHIYCELDSIELAFYVFNDQEVYLFFNSISKTFPIKINRTEYDVLSIMTAIQEYLLFYRARFYHSDYDKVYKKYFT